MLVRGPGYHSHCSSRQPAVPLHRRGTPVSAVDVTPLNPCVRACRHCHQPRCDTCGPAKCVDLPVLGATAALLLAGFSAVAWQLVALVFTAS